MVAVKVHLSQFISQTRNGKVHLMSISKALLSAFNVYTVCNDTYTYTSLHEKKRNKGGKPIEFYVCNIAIQHNRKKKYLILCQLLQ